MGDIDALQLAGFISTDLKPVLYFLPKSIHLCVDFGFSYSMGLKVEPKSSKYEGDPTYGGVGITSGLNIDYHLEELPIALRFFANNTIVPQGIPFPEEKTGFINFGANIILALKRHHN